MGSSQSPGWSGNTKFCSAAQHLEPHQSTHCGVPEPFHQPEPWTRGSTLIDGEPSVHLDSKDSRAKHAVSGAGCGSRTMARPKNSSSAHRCLHPVSGIPGIMLEPDSLTLMPKICDILEPWSTLLDGSGIPINLETIRYAYCYRILSNQPMTIDSSTPWS